MNALHIVATLLESDYDDLDSELLQHYVDHAHIPWTKFSLIPDSEWRALFRQYGFRVKSLYRLKGKQTRTIPGYPLMSVLLAPKDGRKVDYADAAFMADYAYEFIEQRLGIERSKLGMRIRPDTRNSMSNYSHETYNYEGPHDFVDLSFEPDTGNGYHNDFHPLRNYR